MSLPLKNMEFLQLAQEVNLRLSTVQWLRSRRRIDKARQQGLLCCQETL